MAVKAGQIVHVGNGTVLIDRIQSAGPGQLNINTERISELGNYKTVATVRDIPDLTFSLESLDASTEIERMLTDFGTGEIGDAGLDLATVKPIDVSSQFKMGLSATDPTLVSASVAVPYVSPESISYRFGLRDNASQQISLRGDTIFYNQGATFQQRVAGTGAANQAIVTANPAFQAAVTDGRRVLVVEVDDRRLTFGADYTETAGAVSSGAAIATVTLKDIVPTTSKVRIMYAGPTPVQYAQGVHPVPGTPVSATVKPAAVKGRDIEVYVGGYDPDDVAGSLQYKFPSVQSVQLDWRATIDKDEEFGNAFAVSQDYSDNPAVTGTVNIKPRSVPDFMKLVRQITGVTDATKSIGPDSAVPLSIDVVLLNPDRAAGSREVIKRLRVPDARFTVPGFTGQVQQKLAVDLPLESDTGTLLVFDA